MFAVVLNDGREFRVPASGCDEAIDRVIEEPGICRGDVAYVTSLYE